MWTVYILECADKSLYTGIALDVERRLKEHASGKGSRYLRGKTPLRVVYTERKATKSLALKREAEIKSWSRQKKLYTIEKRTIH